MTEELHEIWVYLAASPLLGLTLTLLAYLGADWLYRRSGERAVLNPVLVAALALAGLLLVTGTPYGTYFEGAQFVHFLLGPATVALAVPLYNQLALVRRAAGAAALTLVTGAVVAAGSAVGLAWLAGGSTQTLASLAPKSVTTPIAMGIAEQLDGLPSLTAVMVVITGVVGGAAGPWLLARIGVVDPRAVGFALGLTSHGIGVARAFRINERSGAFAALAMGLNGLLTAALLPVIWRLLE